MSGLYGQTEGRVRPRCLRPATAGSPRSPRQRPAGRSMDRRKRCTGTTPASPSAPQDGGNGVAHQPAGEADQDRRQGGQPPPLRDLPDGRGRRATAEVPANPDADSPAAGAIGSSMTALRGQTARMTTEEVPLIKANCPDQTPRGGQPIASAAHGTRCGSNLLPSRLEVGETCAYQLRNPRNFGLSPDPQDGSGAGRCFLLMLPHVFISYRHGDPEHNRSVRWLGELLRINKIEVALDQIYQEEHPGGPDEGWRKWCEINAAESMCVLIIASEGWFEAYDGKGTPLEGLGAALEANVLGAQLYRDRGRNPRIRLAFLDGIPAERVPPLLSEWHHFRPFRSEEQLDDLVRWVAGCLGRKDAGSPRVRWPHALPFRPDLADRANIEWPAIVELLAGGSGKRILMFEGANGLGKSALVEQAAVYAQKLGIPVVNIDLKGGGLDIAAIIGQFNSDLDLHLPTLSQENQTHLLLNELQRQHRPVVVIFDSYEYAAGNPTVADWLNQQLLNRIGTALGIVAIIAGERVPDYRETGWKDLVLHLHLEPITQIKHWKPWVEQHFPDFLNKGADLPTVLMLARGNPAIVSTACEAIAKS